MTWITSIKKWWNKDVETELVESIELLQSELRIVFKSEDGLPYVSHVSGEPSDIGKALFLIMETGFDLSMLSYVKESDDKYHKILMAYNELCEAKDDLEKIYNAITDDGPPSKVMVKPSQVFIPGVFDDNNG